MTIIFLLKNCMVLFYFCILATERVVWQVNMCILQKLEPLPKLPLLRRCSRLFLRNGYKYCLENVFILEKKYTIRVHISLHVKLLIADNYETEAKTPQCNNIRIDNVPFNANHLCCLQPINGHSAKESGNCWQKEGCH